jgi:hypothetical protein
MRHFKQHLDMKVKPEQLPEIGYFLIDKLEHKELIPFIRKYLNKRTYTSFFYYAINLMLFLIAIVFFVLDFQKPDFILLEWIYHYFIGFSIAFLLVPLHEYIHVVAYQSQGADNTSYDANIKKFYFMALADKFVANRKAFRVVALAPFLVISGLLLAFLYFANHTWVLTIWGILFCHTAMCSGDFGILSYFEFHKDKEVVTYDDVKNKITYFYGRTEETKKTA